MKAFDVTNIQKNENDEYVEFEIDCGGEEKKINGKWVMTGGTCGPQTGLPGTGTVVPEPSTYALMGAGLLGIFGVSRRRRQA